MQLNAISAVIICCNEEAKIETALRSLESVVDEIVVVDSGSQDRTLEICRQFQARICIKSWAGFREQKQYATDQAGHDWVLSLDADEELSPELQEELVQWKGAGEPESAGYLIPRKAFFMGRWIEHTTWYPNWQLRLFRKSSGKWGGGRVHESFRISGPVGRLHGHLYHYTYSNLSEFLMQLDRFSGLAAADLHDRKIRAVMGHVVIEPPLVFLKNYLLHAGFLEGKQGLVVSLLASVSHLFKYLKLLELNGLNEEERRR